MKEDSTNILALIIPFYNEENRFEEQEFTWIFRQYPQIKFILVDDKSTDATPNIIRRLAEKFPHVSCILNPKNKGKAESIRTGVNSLNRHYNYIGYLDADLATPMEELVKLLEVAQEQRQKKFVMGTRVKLLGNEVKRSLTRHYFGRIFATFVSQLVLQIPVYDTQCGAKIIEYQLAQKIFASPFITKWLFDVELLLRFKQIDENFDQKTIEVPLQTWIEKGASTIKWYEFLATPFQIIRLYAKYR